jgi:hypothetical protein
MNEKVALKNGTSLIVVDDMGSIGGSFFRGVQTRNEVNDHITGRFKPLGADLARLAWAQISFDSESSGIDSEY